MMSIPREMALIVQDGTASPFPWLLSDEDWSLAQQYAASLALPAHVAACEPFTTDTSQILLLRALPDPFRLVGCRQEHAHAQETSLLQFSTLHGRI